MKIEKIINQDIREGDILAFSDPTVEKGYSGLGIAYITKNRFSVLCLVKPIIQYCYDADDRTIQFGNLLHGCCKNGNTLFYKVEFDSEQEKLAYLIRNS